MMKAFTLMHWPYQQQYGASIQIQSYQAVFFFSMRILHRCCSAFTWTLFLIRSLFMENFSKAEKNELEDFRLWLSLVVAATYLQSDSFAPAQFQPTTTLALRSAARALLFQDRLDSSNLNRLQVWPSYSSNPWTRKRRELKAGRRDVLGWRNRRWRGLLRLMWHKTTTGSFETAINLTDASSQSHNLKLNSNHLGTILLTGIYCSILT